MPFSHDGSPDRAANLQSLLNLISRREISPLLLPELISIALGVKKLIRTTLSSQALSKILNAIPGSIGESFTMQCDAIGNGWSETRTIGPLTGQVHADDIVAIIGFERSSIDLAAAAELSGSNSRMAELLGYPRCCTEAYQEISKLRDRWALYYATSQPANQGIFSANRLASHIAGVSLVGEMFPCSIHCLEAAAYGQSNLQLMKRSGLNALANLYQDILQRPILINSEGEVSFYSDPNSLTPGAVTISFMGQNVE